MSIDAKKAQEDLAFLRTLVDDQGATMASFGQVYLAAGLIYGAQCVINAGLLLTGAQVSTAVWLAVGFVPTAIFLIINIAYVWRDRKAPFGNTTSTKAIGAIAAGIGLASLILAMTLGFIAYDRGDFSIWLLFSPIICGMQGGVWFAIAVLRRRLWLWLTAFGWYGSAIMLGLLHDADPGHYVLAIGAALLLCMAVPGYVIMRQSQNTQGSV